MAHGLRKPNPPQTKNFYSYTMPSNPSINHHWGAGVTYFWLFKKWGFNGPHVLNILLFSLTIWFFFQSARTLGGWKAAFFITVLSIPLIVRRREIRPEFFSMFFLSMYFFLLSRYKQGRITLIPLFILPFIQAIWVNIHIFFVFGPLITPFFLISKEKIKNIGNWAGEAVLLIALGAACFINPFGLENVLYPLTIFKNYGYMLVENISPWMLFQRFGERGLLYCFMYTGLVATLILLGFTLKKWRKHIPMALLLIFFGALSLKVNRAIPLFGLVSIPLATYFLAQFSLKLPYKSLKIVKISLMLGCLVLLMDGVWNKKSFFHPIHPSFGLGLLPYSHYAAQFFVKNNIQGPIFNNYDIGAYLIFHLFPKERVFVDNRPEAYSNKFFTDTYIPMQENEKIWAQKSKKWK